MRSKLIPILMASALVPAAAQAGERERSADRRADRVEQREERARPERRQSSNTTAQSTSKDAPRVERSQPKVDTVEQYRERRFEQRRNPRTERPTMPQQAESVPSTSGTSTVTTEGQRKSDFERFRDKVIRDGKRVDDRRDERHGEWHRDWRHDNRYDWKRHRDRNRWVFRIGTYFDPYRYGYRRFSIGYNLWPSYYGSNYWLEDPWMYRLPPAYGPYRWVRYYNDALLVNIYTGQVVDVIYGFFW